MFRSQNAKVLLKYGILPPTALSTNPIHRFDFIGYNNTTSCRIFEIDCNILNIYSWICHVYSRKNTYFLSLEPQYHDERLLRNMQIKFFIRISHLNSINMNNNLKCIYMLKLEKSCQKWDSNPRLENQTATWTQRLRPLGHPDYVILEIDIIFGEPIMLIIHTKLKNICWLTFKIPSNFCRLVLSSSYMQPMKHYQ